MKYTEDCDWNYDENDLQRSGWPELVVLERGLCETSWYYSNGRSRRSHSCDCLYCRCDYYSGDSKKSLEPYWLENSAIYSKESVVNFDGNKCDWNWDETDFVVIAAAVAVVIYVAAAHWLFSPFAKRIHCGPEKSYNLLFWIFMIYASDLPWLRRKIQFQHQLESTL
jgi:hypothetical protein